MKQQEGLNKQGSGPSRGKQKQKEGERTKTEWKK